MPTKESECAKITAQICALPLEQKRRLLIFLRFLTESEYTAPRPGACQEKELPGVG